MWSWYRVKIWAMRAFWFCAGIVLRKRSELTLPNRSSALSFYPGMRVDLIEGPKWRVWKIDAQKGILTLMALVAFIGCAGTNQALEDAAKAKAELDSIRSEVVDYQTKLTALQAKASGYCEQAIAVLHETEAVAPFACSLVDAAPDSEATKVPKLACAKQSMLPDAVRNVEKACGLLGGPL